MIVCCNNMIGALAVNYQFVYHLIFFVIIKFMCVYVCM